MIKFWNKALIVISIILILKIIKSDAQDPLCQDIPGNTEYLVCPKTINTTHPRQVPEDTSSLTPDQIEKRNKTLNHLKRLGMHFAMEFPMMLNYGERCDPVMHDKYFNMDSILPIYHSGEWYGKICLFTRFLHCDPTEKICKCAPKDVYNVDLQPITNYLDPTRDHGVWMDEKAWKHPCIAKDHELCYFQIDKSHGKTWPGLDYPLEANLKCPYDTNVACQIYYEKSTNLYAERCGQPPNDTATTASGSLLHSYFLLLPFNLMLHILICKF